MKQKIIEILHNATSDSPISGVEISNRLGISRVAVWKHMNQLKESGYGIISTPKGYKLVNNQDLLMPLFFNKRAESIHFFSTLSSTMDKARELARNGAPHLSVVIAEEQNRGRGRLNRIWSSDKGGLWFTLILRPELPPPLAFQVNFAASLSLAKVLRQEYELDVSVKWPNDLLLKVSKIKRNNMLWEGKNTNSDEENQELFLEKKLAGLLSEMETQGDMISFVNIGIGINVNNYPEINEPNAVSIRTAIGKKICRRQLLSSFLDELEKQLIKIQSLQNPSVELMNQWKNMTSTIGRHVRIETFGDIYKGVAVDVDTTGALIIRQEDGVEKKIIYGDCFYHNPHDIS